MPPSSVITSPEQFASEGFTVVDPDTLIGTPVYQAVETKLRHLIDHVEPKLGIRPPRPYQLRYATMAACRQNNLLAHEAGTGKTFESALVIMALYGSRTTTFDRTNLRPGAIHIVAPKHTLRHVWLKELAKVGLVTLDKDGHIQGGHAEIIDSERAARMSKQPIWIYHYDLLKRQTERGKRTRRENKTGHPIYKLFRKRFAPGLLILDEVHRLRANTDRTFAIRELRKRVKRVLALTGTPMDGWVAHLASILGVVFQEESPAFPVTVNQFTRRFTRTEITTRDFTSGEIDRASAKRRPAPGIATDQLPAFHRITRHLIHRLTFKDPEVSGQVQFPAMDRQTVLVTPDPAHLAFYQRVHHDMMKEISAALSQMDQGKLSRHATRVNVLTHLNVLRAAANHPWTMDGRPSLQQSTTAKLETVKQLMLQYKAAGRKVIIFTNRIAVGGKLEGILKKAGLNVVRIYDTDDHAKPKKLNQEDREKRIEQFQDDDTVDGMIGNLRLISEGLTLVEASVVIHIDHDWPSNQWTQGNARVVRPGQSFDPVPVLDVLLDQTVDGYVHAGMLRKAIATAQTIDNEFDTEESATVDPLEVARALLDEEQQHGHPEGGGQK